MSRTLETNEKRSHACFEFLKKEGSGVEQKILSGASLGVTLRRIDRLCCTDVSTAGAESTDGPQRALLTRLMDENVAEKRANYQRYEKIL